ncbi:hypothetical protein EI94DRAFT_1715502 [Lactarius quietus]|nr:hypothetical protein EI94DRAFT_1715502 [Lactarius quietus]
MSPTLGSRLLYLLWLDICQLIVRWRTLAVYSYTENLSAIQHRRLTLVLSSHCNIYSQFMENFPSKYLNIPRHHLRA